MSQDPSAQPIAPPRTTTRLPVIVVGLVSLLGIAWRVVDVTEWPYPFFQPIQYESALAARSLWIAATPEFRSEEQLAWFQDVRYGHIVSPPILPALVAITYLITGHETPWVSKLYAAAFWVIASWFLYGAIVRLTGCRWAGVASQIVLLFIPFGLQVSRSFQTESTVVCGFAIALWWLSRFRTTLTWREVVVAGWVCGFAALLKPGTLQPPLAMGFLTLTLCLPGRMGRRFATVAAFTFLLVLPSAVYVLLMLKGRGGEIQPHLLAEREFYVRLLRIARDVVGLWHLGFGVLGAVVAILRGRGLLLGVFLGYVGYLSIFTYHCSTHDYYHTVLFVPISLGVGILASEWVRVSRLVMGPTWGNSLWFESLSMAVVLGAITAYVMTAKTPWAGPWRFHRDTRAGLAAEYAREDLRTRVALATRSAIRPGGRVVAITDEYGFVFEFATHLRVAIWARQSDMRFLTDAGVEKPQTPTARLDGYLAQGYDYFAVSDRREYESQPELVATLNQRAKIIVNTAELLLFDLRQPPCENP